MARISRKGTAAEQSAAPAALFRAGGYTRLSVEDKDFGDSGSLENQKSMIENYVKQSQEIQLCSMHTDNGETGTNFNRPGFEALMDDVRNNKINCIIVKDLSRFGRDYVEAGSLLEIILPRLGVRFISINDNFDSFDPRCQGEGVIIALKNMINSFYSKDIAAKIRSSYEMKQKNGEFSGSKPPFGYFINEDKSKLIVDPEAAEYVRQIFSLKLDGLSVCQISSWLNAHNIPTPGHYRYIKGIFKDKRYKNPQIWNDTSVIKILKAPTYLGHLTAGKKRANPNRVYDYIDQPKEKWLITENTHEAIISQVDFDRAGELLNQTHEQIKQRVYKKWDNPENIFQGLVYCGDCGHVFGRKRITSAATGYTSYAFICASCKKGSPDKTKRSYMKSDVFYDVIFQTIQQQIKTCADARRIIEKIQADDPNKKKRVALENEIRQTQGRLDRLPALKLKLYDDYYSGIIDEADYKLFGKKYDEEVITKTVHIERLKMEIKKYLPEFANENKRITAMEQFQNEIVLTRKMLLALVERIEVKGDLSFTIFYRFEDEYEKILPYIPIEKGGIGVYA